MKRSNTLNTRRGGKALRLFSALLILFASKGAWAACTQTNVPGGGPYYTATVSGVNPPAFNPASYSVGQTIYTASGTVTIDGVTGSNATFTCNPAAQPFGVGLAPNPAGALDFISLGTATGNVYPTAIPGIGLKLSNATYGAFPTAVAGGSYASSSWNQTFKITVSIIKTSTDVRSGVLEGNFAAYVMGSATGQVAVAFHWTGGGVPIQPIVPACTVHTTDVQVPLGTFATTAFTGPGSVSPAKDFSINLDCAGGNAGTYVNAYVTLSDVANPGNVSTTLPLDNTSSAQGVGIQILNNGTPVAFGPAATGKTVGNTNQWLAGSISQGTSTFSIPLKAQYIQTGSTVKGGTANSVAYFTIAYQ